jgi:phosphohistidine phosphatase SixA
LVILIRHGKRSRNAYANESQHWLDGYYPNEPQKWPPAKFDGDGTQMARALAARLADELEREDIKISKILHSTHVVAAQTAAVYAHMLKRRKVLQASKPDPWDLLTPGTHAASSKARDVAHSIRQFDLPAVVIVGHQPEITEIANELLTPESKIHRWFLRWFGKIGVPAGVLPLGHAESALVSISDPPALQWCLTAKPESLRKLLIDKIQAKYDVAKFFLGAFVVNSGLVLNAGVFKALVDQPGIMRFAALWLGILLLIMAIGLTIATLFGYDQLLMPREFWGSSSTSQSKKSLFKRLLGRFKRILGRLLTVHDVVRRPPSQDQIVLYFNMIRIWSNLFVPALSSAFLSIGCFLFVLLSSAVPVEPWLLASQFVGSAIVLVLLAAWVFKTRGPSLGVDD